MTAKQLIAAAAACQTCGQEHKPWPRQAGYAPSYASKKDGHPYRSTLPLSVVTKLRAIEAGL